jgi:hypothetical protein
MEFWRLNILWFLILPSCALSVDNTFVYEAYIIGQNRVIDSIIIDSNKTGNLTNYWISESSYVSADSFSITENKEMLILQLSNCNEDIKIRFVDAFVNNNHCRSIYPFFLESIILLDSKAITIANKNYKVLKLSNESYSESSVVFWLEGFGILLIGLEYGKYYILNEVNNSEIPWKAILTHIVEDTDFSELRPIPPTPPLPF